jgi:hypothetical protein
VFVPPVTGWSMPVTARNVESKLTCYCVRM